MSDVAQVMTVNGWREPYYPWDGEGVDDLDQYHTVDEELELGGRVLFHLERSDWWQAVDAHYWDPIVRHYYRYPESRMFLSVLANILDGRTWKDPASFGELTRITVQAALDGDDDE